MGFLELQNVPEVGFGASTLDPDVQVAILFQRHPYICSTTVLHDTLKFFPILFIIEGEKECT